MREKIWCGHLCLSVQNMIILCKIPGPKQRCLIFNTFCSTTTALLPFAALRAVCLNQFLHQPGLTWACVWAHQQPSSAGKLGCRSWGVSRNLYPSWHILKVFFLVCLLFEGCVRKSWETEVCLEEWHLWCEWARACHATAGIWIGLPFSSVALDNIDEGFMSICEIFALQPGSLQVMENTGGEAGV